MNILVFTGGGLSPALNPTIYGVAQAAKKHGFNIWGGLYGWKSVLPGGKIINLSKLNLLPLKSRGGTILRSSRTNPLADPNNVNKIKKFIKKNKIDGIVAIGGDDTLGAAQKLAELGLPIVGVPKTIDNDLFGTYFTLGYPSAAHYLIDFVKQIKEDAAYALSRIFVIEALGMKAGWLACASIYGGADVIITPEKPVDLDLVIKLTKERYKRNGNFAVVVVAQEADFKGKLTTTTDHQIGEQYGRKRNHFICLALRDEIKKQLGVDVKALYPGNYLESDKPTAIDNKFAIALGEKAVNLIIQKQFGLMPNIVYKNNKLITGVIDLKEATAGGKFRTLPEEFFNQKQLLPSKQFLNYLKPILGDRPPEDNYAKLVKKITTHA
ncbi:MAG: 6-phosphofructokinase [Candidatus Magasanikbacteria bacterium]